MESKENALIVYIKVHFDLLGFKLFSFEVNGVRESIYLVTPWRIHRLR